MPVQKDVVISINHNHFLGGVTMDGVEITLKVIKGIEEAIVNGYNRFYMMLTIWKMEKDFCASLLCLVQNI